nr:MAG TPA: hypothetical protein [Caudoviricetes sp.]
MEMNPNPLYALDNNGALTLGSRISQSMPYDAESQLIRGTMSFSKDRLRELDPSYTGYSHIFVLRMPAFMTAIANGNVISGYDSDSVAIAQMHCKNLKALLELGSTSYSGTPDLELNTTNVNTGFAERNYAAPLTSAYEATTFQINCLETRGEPLRRALEYYINGISDANVKATMLHGALNADGSLMDPSLPNYTFAIMVVQTDQTMLRIQDISLWNSCIATTVSRSDLDWTNGDINIAEPKTVQFSGVYMPDSNNASVVYKAKQLLGQRMQYYKRFKDMTDKEIGTPTWQVTGNAY